MTATDFEAARSDDKILVRLPMGTEGEFVARTRKIRVDMWLLLQVWKPITDGARRQLTLAHQLPLQAAFFVHVLDALLPKLDRWGYRMPRVGLEALASRWRFDVEAKGEPFDRAVTHILRALGAVEATRDADALTELARRAFELRWGRDDATHRPFDDGWGAGEAPIRRSGRRSVAARELLADVKEVQAKFARGVCDVDDVAAHLEPRVRYFCPTLGVQLGPASMDGAERRMVRALETLTDKGDTIDAVEPDAIGRLALIACGMSAQDAANFFKWVG